MTDILIYTTCGFKYIRLGDIAILWDKDIIVIHGYYHKKLKIFNRKPEGGYKYFTV